VIIVLGTGAGADVGKGDKVGCNGGGEHLWGKASPPDKVVGSGTHQKEGSTARWQWRLWEAAFRRWLGFGHQRQQRWGPTSRGKGGVSEAHGKLGPGCTEKGFTEQGKVVAFPRDLDVAVASRRSYSDKRQDGKGKVPHRLLVGEEG
jgi:hypothetical protein